MDKSIKILAMSVVASMFFVGCGGGGSSSSSNNNTSSEDSTIQSGVFVDAPVKGLSYKTATQSGYTDKKGTFNYKSGEEVTFKLGNLTLGTVDGGSLITPYTIAGDTNIDKPSAKATKIAMILQSFDATRSDSTILDISKLKDYNFSSINLNIAIDDMSTKLSSLLATSSFQDLIDDINHTVVDAITANSNMKTNLKHYGVFNDNSIMYSGNVELKNLATLLINTNTTYFVIKSCYDGPFEKVKIFRPKFAFKTLSQSGSNIKYSSVEVTQAWESSTYKRTTDQDSISKIRYNNAVKINGNTLVMDFGDWKETMIISSARYVSSIAGVHLHKGVIEVRNKYTNNDEDWEDSSQHKGTAITTEEYVNQAINNSWGRDGYCLVELEKNGKFEYKYWLCSH